MVWKISASSRWVAFVVPPAPRVKPVNDVDVFPVYCISSSPIKRKPESSFFDKLGDAEVKDRDGNDGLKRFFTGVYESFEEAKYAMKMLRKTGYSDAFVRKLSKYEELWPS